MNSLYFLWSAFGVFWLALALRPHDRSVWIAEHVLTVITAAVLLATAPRWPLSLLAHALIVAFLVLHTIGAYFTYVRVPYDATARRLFGGEINRRFGWVRNHYDRLVHFAYGLLMSYPFYELLERYAAPEPGWSVWLAAALIMASSLLFEVFEWWATELLGQGSGTAYIGAQGDEWDAQKDMALATAGSFIALAVIWFLSP